MLPHDRTRVGVDDRVLLGIAVAGQRAGDDQRGVAGPDLDDPAGPVSADEAVGRRRAAEAEPSVLGEEAGRVVRILGGPVTLVAELLAQLGDPAELFARREVEARKLADPRPDLSLVEVGHVGDGRVEVNGKGDGPEFHARVGARTRVGHPLDHGCERGRHQPKQAGLGAQNRPPGATREGS